MNPKRVDLTPSHDHAHPHGHGHAHDHGSTHDDESGTAVDPVCGMSVTIADAVAKGLHVHHEGTDYYFCGRGCTLEFEEDPGRYLDPAYVPSM